MLNRTMPYVFWTSSIKNNYCNCSRKQLLQGCKIWVQGWNKFWQHLVPFVLAKLFIIAQWTLRFYHLFLVTGKGTINVLASPPPSKKKKRKELAPLLHYLMLLTFLSACQDIFWNIPNNSINHCHFLWSICLRLYWKSNLSTASLRHYVCNQVGSKPRVFDESIIHSC